MNKKQKRNLDEAFKALREQFCPDSFRIIMHERLFRESQKANESLDTYIQRFNRMVSVLDHTEEQRVVLFISNLQPPDDSKAKTNARGDRAGETSGSGRKMY